MARDVRSSPAYCWQNNNHCKIERKSPVTFGALRHHTIAVSARCNPLRRLNRFRARCLQLSPCQWQDSLRMTLPSPNLAQLPFPTRTQPTIPETAVAHAVSFFSMYFILPIALEWNECVGYMVERIIFVFVVVFYIQTCKLDYDSHAPHHTQIPCSVMNSRILSLGDRMTLFRHFVSSTSTRAY
jgi:hypothetical protein